MLEYPPPWKEEYGIIEEDVYAGGGVYWEGAAVPVYAGEG